MIQRLCEPEHLAIIILVLLVALLVVGSGKGLSSIIVPFFKKVFGNGSTEVNLNLGGDMGGKPSKESPCSVCGKFDPKDCPFHEAEHERSLRNENDIKALWEQYGKMGDEMRAGFRDVQKCINESQKVIIGALGSRPRGE
jgi:hypothetical protein